ncbi:MULTISPECIES: transcriptional regulator domain-containing protein [Methylocaldum]|jgi:hypothetical protein|uniref:transcriptional regulator domain-containing protein n=1 Tax=Methylocaldum sp. 14B TaxID=1912213 RepID=UPI00098A98D3|nr:DUF6499 domain-containing protein [Methylocaldum sp. 14B]
MKNDNPDWKNPADYPDADTTSLYQWAWEFFRRNPSYRRDYDEYARLPRESLGDGLLPDGIISRFCKCEPAAMPGESVTQFALRGGKRIGTPREYFSERYRLSKLLLAVPNPYRSLPPNTPVFDTDLTKMLTYDISKVYEHCGIKTGLTPETDREIVITIDLDLPLETQFENIKTIIETKGLIRGFKHRKNHRSKYPLYLRAFDARQENKGAAEIADGLRINDPQTINKYLKAANNLIHRDYWKLAAMHKLELGK